MTVQTGRTVNRYCTVHLDDSGGTLRELKVNKLGGVGLSYEEMDSTAFSDAIKGVLLGLPSFTTTIEGPFDTTANGTHATLSGVNGGNTPLSFDARLGMRHAWEAGEPQFGITASATDGVLVSEYVVNVENMSYSAKISMAAGSAAPAWGTVAET